MTALLPNYISDSLPSYNEIRGQVSSLIKESHQILYQVASKVNRIAKRRFKTIVMYSSLGLIAIVAGIPKGNVFSIITGLFYNLFFSTGSPIFSDFCSEKSSSREEPYLAKQREQHLDNLIGKLKRGPEWACIYGPSGSGKTSFLDCLSYRLITKEHHRVFELNAPKLCVNVNSIGNLQYDILINHLNDLVSFKGDPSPVTLVIDEFHAAGSSFHNLLKIKKQNMKFNLIVALTENEYTSLDKAMLERFMGSQIRLETIPSEEIIAIAEQTKNERYPGVTISSEMIAYAMTVVEESAQGKYSHSRWLLENLLKDAYSITKYDHKIEMTKNYINLAANGYQDDDWVYSS